MEVLTRTEPLLYLPVLPVRPSLPNSIVQALDRLNIKDDPADLALHRLLPLLLLESAESVDRFSVVASPRPENDVRGW